MNGPPADPPEAGVTPLRVLTLNVHKGFTALNRHFMLPALRQALHEVGADLVFLQEVLGEHAGHARRHAQHWPAVPQYEYLADTLWRDHAYGRNAVSPESHHGNALLSRFPILRHRNHDISQPGDEPRGLLHAVIQLPEPRRELHAVCVHLGLRESHRRRQLQQLCELLRDEVPADAPVVVAGDFNDWRRRAHGLLAGGAGLQEVYLQAQGRSARSFPARLPVLQLERIYVRNLRLHRPLPLPRRPWTHLSDHTPLAAEIVP